MAVAAAPPMPPGGVSADAVSASRAGCVIRRIAGATAVRAATTLLVPLSRALKTLTPTSAHVRCPGASAMATPETSGSGTAAASTAQPCGTKSTALSFQTRDGGWLVDADAHADQLTVLSFSLVPAHRTTGAPTRATEPGSGDLLTVPSATTPIASTHAADGISVVIDVPGTARLLSSDRASAVMRAAVGVFPTTRPLDLNGACAGSGSDASDVDVHGAGADADTGPAAGGGALPTVSVRTAVAVPAGAPCGAGTQSESSELREADALEATPDPGLPVDCTGLPPGCTRVVLTVCPPSTTSDDEPTAIETPARDGRRVQVLGDRPCIVAVGIVHERRDSAALAMPHLGSDVPTALFTDGLTVLTANTTRKSGGKDPAETLKDLKKRLATGALVRMLPPQGTLAGLNDALSPPAVHPPAAIDTVVGLRKKHWLSIYIDRPTSFDVDDLDDAE